MNPHVPAALFKGELTVKAPLRLADVHDDRLLSGVVGHADIRLAIFAVFIGDRRRVVLVEIDFRTEVDGRIYVERKLAPILGARIYHIGRKGDKRALPY